MASEKKRLHRIASILLLLLIVMMQYVSLQWSMFPSTTKLLRQGVYLFINFGIMLAINLVLFFAIRKWTVTLIITGIISTLWGIINHYVYMFHGAPLYLSTIKSAGAAFDVLGHYRITVDRFVLGVLLALIIEAGLICCYSILNKKEKRRSLKKFLFEISSLCIDCCLILLVVICQVFPIKKVTIGATWNASVRDYGFLCCWIKDAENIINPLNKPDGYSDEVIGSINFSLENNKDKKSQTSPDIILILNESFCDLCEASVLETDVDSFESLTTINGAKNWKSVAPNIGGGTNNSEYELLTSNSMFLLQSEAPFNYLNLEKNGSNIVEYLESLGYSTYGMHCGAATNYSRNRGYPSLGFDNILLGEEKFIKNSYGNRAFLDSDNYEDLISQYEKDQSSPKFIYLLTLQNHGGYDQNDSSFDSVHCLSDYGEYTDQISEYLTSVKMSSDAFAELTKYFETVERPVIVCMVGDHAPSFIGNISDADCDEEKMALRQRMVPFILWSNYDADFPEDIDTVTMCDIAPIIAETAGLPLSPYYSYIREIQKKVPIRTSYGLYITANGEKFQYGEGGAYDEMLQNYYFLEYNSIKSGKDNHPELYQPLKD